MGKIKLFKTLFLTSLLAVSTSGFAASLNGNYCTPAGYGTLVMHFVATDAKHGTLSVFNANPRGNACMRGARDYTLKGKAITDVNGLKGTLNSSTNVTISEPRNWAGTYDQATCPEELTDPC